MARKKCSYHMYVAIKNGEVFYLTSYDDASEKLGVTRWKIFAALNGKNDCLIKMGIRIYSIEEYYELSPIREQRIGPAPKTGRKRKKVNMLDPYTCEVIDTFDSLRDAADDLGEKFTTNIGKCCRGQIKTAHGYKWEYAL